MEIGDWWPHKFTRDGSPTQIGEDKNTFLGGTPLPIMAQPMICVHCHARFMQGKESPPPGPCPARNTKAEVKRIKNG